MPEKKIQFTGCSQASLNMRKDLLEGIRWLIIVFAPLPVSTPARPFGVGGCGDWEGGLYKKGPLGVCLSYLISIWTQIRVFPETGDPGSTFF